MSGPQGDCPGCIQPRPRELTPAELKRIPAAHRKEIEASPGRALVCGYCGCVHKVNVPVTVFGYLNNPLKGGGWVKIGTTDSGS